MILRASLRKKLMLVSFVPGIFLVAVGGVGFYSLRKVTKIYDKVITVNMANEETLTGMQARAYEVMRFVTKAAIPENTPEELAQLKGKFEDVILVYENSSGFYRNAAVEAGQGELFDKMQGEWTQMTDLGKEVFRLAEEHKASGRARVHEITSGEFMEASKAFETHLGAFLDMEKGDGDKLLKEIGKVAAFGNVLSGMSVLAGFCLALALGWLFSGRIAGVLRESAAQLGGVVTELSGAFGKVISAGEVLSRSSQTQESFLEETAASVSQVRGTIQKTEVNAEKSRALSTKSLEKAGQGKSIVDEMIRKIEEIHKSNLEISGQVETSSAEILEFIEVVRNIGQKTKVINEIAFQTKLLSFNASVEAARAGEHGRGFAVVAEEVGNLAKVSAEAAQEITSLLENSTQKVEQMASTIKTQVGAIVTSGTSKVQEGVTIAHRCGDALGTIVDETSLVRGAVEEITASCKEQARGIAEIEKAMKQLQQAALETATQTRESEQAAFSVQAQTDQIRRLVLKLMETVGGEMAAETEKTPASEAGVSPEDTLLDRAS